jgi:hypothetical protein
MPNQPKTPVRSVRVSDVLWGAAQDEAARRGETVTAVIVRALEEYTQRSFMLQPPKS